MKNKSLYTNKFNTIHMVKSREERNMCTIEISKSVRQEIRNAKLIFRQKNVPTIVETYDQCIMRMKANSRFLIFLATDKNFKKFMNKKANTNPKYKAMKKHLYGDT